MIYVAMFIILCIIFIAWGLFCYTLGFDAGYEEREPEEAA